MSDVGTPAPPEAPQLTFHHFLNLANGEFSSTSRAQLTALFQNYRAVDGGQRPLLVHFHGGLVDEKAGMTTAGRLLPEYWRAGAYPVFFVWEAGLWEVVSRNLPAIFQESIFTRLVRRVVQFAVGKARESGETRGLMLELPDDLEVRDELLRAGAGVEPYTSEAEALAGAGDLTTDQESQLRTVLENDPVVSEWAAAVASEGEQGARGLGPDVAVTTLMSPEVLDEIRSSAEPGTRGLVSTARIVKGAVAVLGRVISRVSAGRGHGLYTTVVEEVLREFYLASAGRLVWSQMKKDTEDAFSGPAATHGGSAFVAELAAAVEAGSRPRVVLVGHSTGAVYICHLLQHADAALKAVEGETPVRFDLVFLAPACTFTLMAETLRKVRHRIGNLRVFAMKDELESTDQLVQSEKLPQAAPLLRLVYPRSLLYFVSGVTEDEADMPLVGMERYYSRREPYVGGSVGEVVDYLEGVKNASVWSISGAGNGLLCESKHHGDFDNDPQTLRSIEVIVREGYGNGA